MLSIDGLDELQDIIQKVMIDVHTLEDILEEPEFLNELRDIVAENFEEIFASEGSSIDEDWDGHSLVDTGRLKASLVNPGELRIQVYTDAIVFGSDVPYSGYVNDRYRWAGIETEKVSEIGDLINRWLREYGEYGGWS